MDENELIANTFLQVDREGMYYYPLPVAQNKIDPTTTQADLSAATAASLCTVREKKRLGNIEQDRLAKLDNETVKVSLLGGDPPPPAFVAGNSGLTSQLLQNRVVSKPSGFNFYSDIGGADKDLDSTIILFVGTDSSGEGIKIPRVN